MKHLEAKLQCNCVKLFGLLYPKLKNLLFAVPNGGFRNPIEAANLKKQGVIPGVSDLILLVPNNSYNSLCIELKTDKGKQSTLQKEWQQTAELFNNKYVIIRSTQQFLDTIHNYLNNLPVD